MIEPKDRFSCAVTTLYVMLMNGQLQQAKAIVLYEIKWGEDPQPPGIGDFGHGISGWGLIYDKLNKLCADPVIPR